MSTAGGRGNRPLLLLGVVTVALVTVVIAVGGEARALALGVAIGVLLVGPLFLLNRIRWKKATAALGPDVVRCVAYSPETHFGYLVLGDQQLSLHAADFQLVGSWPLTGLVVFPDVPVSAPGSSRSRRGFRLNAHPPVDLVCMGTSGWISRRDSEVFVRRLAALGVSMRS